MTAHAQKLMACLADGQPRTVMKHTQVTAIAALSRPYFPRFTGPGSKLLWFRSRMKMGIASAKQPTMLSADGPAVSPRVQTCGLGHQAACKHLPCMPAFEGTAIAQPT